MHFQFSFHGLSLNTEEAETLLCASSPRPEPYNIDLGKAIDLKISAPAELFKQSIADKNPHLAALAAKLAIHAEQKPEVKKIKKSTLAAPIKAAVLPDDFIYSLVSKPSYKSVGTALVLLRGDATNFKSLREIAIAFVNEMYADKKVPKNSVLFRGFVLDKQTNKLIPQDYTAGVSRNESFHVCPLYISLREGLITCKAKSLIETRAEFSTGSHKELASEKSKHLQRKFFLYSLLPAGINIRSTWHDMDEFVVNYFAKKVVAK